jgi:hypothetical protein
MSAYNDGMRRLSVGTALLVVVVAGIGCSPLTPPGFECGSAAACNEQNGGECVVGVGGSFCAYTSANCNGEGQTGYQWGPAAGTNSGCVSAPPNIDRDAGPIDASGSSGPGSGSGNECFGNPSTFQVCLTPAQAATPQSFPPSGDDHVYSGGAGGNHPITSSCDFSVVQDNLNFCVVGGSAMTFDSETYIEDPAGDHPIVFVSSDTITISAAVIANGSLSNNYPGPGSLLGSACAAVAGNNDNNAAGGGAGGTFATTGSNGGNGGQGANGGKASTTVTASATMILPGCWGGSGGELGGGGGDFLPDDQQITNPGGYSGGIVYFIAKNGITVTSSGYVDVGGGGGAAGASQSVGGGGGGTGGFVGLDSAMITMTGFIYARGGAGGGGADEDKEVGHLGPFPVIQHQYGGQGDNGSAQQAQGGQGGGNGGNGGNGPNNAADTGQTGQNGKNNSQGAGGGGGGGNGVIWIVGATVPAGQLVGTVFTNNTP